MDIIDFLVIISGIANLLLGFLVLARGAKNKVTYTLAGLALVSGIWAIVLYLYHLQIFFSSLFWIKIVYLIAFLIVFFVFYFSLVYPSKVRRAALLPSFLYLIVAIPLFYTLFFTKLWVKDIVYKSWGPETILGPVYVPVCIFWSFFSGWAFYNFFQKYVKSTGIDRERIKYILMGLSLFIVTVATVDGAVPVLTSSTKLFRVSPLSSLFIVGFTAYAILRYRLMDIRLVIKRGSVFLLALVIVVGLTLGAIWTIAFFLDYTPNPGLMVGGGVAMAIGVLVFVPLRSFLQTLADRFLFKKVTSYQEAIKNLSSTILAVIDLNRLVDLLVKTTQNMIGLDRAGVLLRDPSSGQYKIQQIIGFREENGISLVKDNFLTDYLQKTKGPLVYEELSLEAKGSSDKKEVQQLLKLRDNMKRIEAELCLPLFHRGEIAGILVLGKKLSRDPYSKEDLDLLAALTNQASIALENARLYDQVQDLSQHLQDKVDEQTKELTVAYKELKRTDQLKSEFLSMSSHQLRTPLTAIKGYLSMVLEGDFGKVPAKLNGVLNNVFTSAQRLVKIVGDLLDVSRIDLGKMELEKSLVQIEDIVQACFEEMEINAEEKGLKLIYQKPPSPLPKLYIDESKIRQVILNLLDNAIRYTKKGQVAVFTRRQGNCLLIKVEDTGAGLTKKEQENIFEGFARGSAGINYFTEGAGLGLYVSRKYLNLHQGKIWAESPGKDKGSTFFVQLPLSS